MARTNSPAPVPHLENTRIALVNGMSTRWTRSRTGRFPPESRHDLRERGQHDSRLHDDQHVFEAVGSLRPRLSGAPRPPHRRSRSSGTPRSSSCAPASHDPTRRGACCRSRCSLATGTACGDRAPRDSRRRSRPALRGVDGLARAYDFILDARFDQVEPELRRACGPAPLEACDVLERDGALVAHPARSRTATRSTTSSRPRSNGRSRRPRRGPSVAPDDAEAWFYLGGAYAARVQWRVLRDEKLAAARDGKRIKQALERAVELDPTPRRCLLRHRDVQATTRTSRRPRRRSCASCCCCRAAIARTGSTQMLRARTRGTAAPGRGGLPAPRHLSLVRAPDRRGRCSCCDALHEHYPGNPLFLAQIAEIQDAYQHDMTASLATLAHAARAAREQRVNAAALRRGAGAPRASRSSSTRCTRPTMRSRMLERVVALQARRAVRRRCRSRTSGWARRTIGWATGAAAIDALPRRQSAVGARRPDPYQRPASRPAERLRRAPDAQRCGGLPPVARGVAPARAQRSAGGAASLLADARSRSTPPTRWRATATAASCRRGGTTPAALARVRARHPRRAQLHPRHRRQRVPRGRAPARTRRRRDEAIAAYRIASTLFGGAAETHAPPRARSRLECSRSETSAVRNPRRRLATR